MMPTAEEIELNALLQRDETNETSGPNAEMLTRKQIAIRVADEDSREDSREDTNFRLILQTLPGDIAHLAFLLFIPWFCYGTAELLRALLYDVTTSAQKAHRAECERRQNHRISAAYNDRWCSDLRLGSATVYVVASTVDLSNSSQSSSRGRRTTGETATPLAERLRQRPAHIWRKLVYNQHWAVVIRGTTYELVRRKGSRDIELKLTHGGQDAHVDAAGVPLSMTCVLEMGQTFLTDTALQYLLRWEAADRAASEHLRRYNLFQNNCQRLWSDRLLRGIVCQCADQPRMRIPDMAISIYEASSHHLVVQYVAFSVIALQKTGICSIYQPLTSYSNIFVDIWELGLIIWTLPLFYRTSEVPRILHQQPPDLLDDFVALPLSEHELRIRRIIRLRIIASPFLCALTIFFGYMHRYTSYKHYVWADLSLGIVTWYLRQSLKKIVAELGAEKCCDALSHPANAGP